MKPMNLKTINNELYLNNFSIKELAEKYNTPLYIFDEKHLRYNMSNYVNNFKSKKFNTNIVYASKAFLVPELCKIVNEESLFMDAVSIGDLFVAKSSSFPMEKIVFHGNNKSNQELEYAIDNQVGIIVVDNLDELVRLDKLASLKKVVVNTMFRVNPGIDVHTHKYIQTALYVSKFGESIYDDDTINNVIEYYKSSKYVKLLGFHSHIGSQIKEVKPFLLNVDKMLYFTKSIEDKFDMKLSHVNLGGGFGIKYYEKDSDILLEYVLNKIIKRIESVSKKLNLHIDNVYIEPGRSIVGTPGITVYECGIIKHTYGGKNFLFINGGMTDNIRPALYQAKYEVEVVKLNSEAEKVVVDVVGKCCESGDFIAKDVTIPTTNPGDYLVVYGTGAYTYSMSSNYNNLIKPCVIFVSDEVKVVSRREEINDLNRLF